MSDWSPDIGRLQAFDEGEWMRVERNYIGRMNAYVARRISDAGAREDIVQEAFLGAVRGIGDFDPIYTFEQYLFGICKNRTIDHMRRQKMVVIQARTEDGDAPGLETLVSDDETPSRIAHRNDLARAAQELLVAILRDWVQETWQQNEFTRLMVIEALFSGGWRNRDTWQRFQLRDETSVAGIKFRALKRLREIAGEKDPKSQLLALLAAAIDEAEDRPALDVGALWRAGRVSCPARHWLARASAASLPAGPAGFLRFHVEEMKCEWCQANADDLARLESAAELEPFLERIGQSTLQYLRSRTMK